jgi:hypothetical protein
LIALDHPARLVWSFVTALELGELYASIKACTHTVGTIDPRLLLALYRPYMYWWLANRVTLHNLEDYSSVI